jgi:signal transduction histidine kinase
LSIKVKLTACISLLVAIILTLNISIFYFSSRKGLQDSTEQQIATIAEQISTTVEVSQQARQYIEDAIGVQLRTAAIAAEFKLNPDIRMVTNGQLTELSRQLGVDHITLWKKTEQDIVAGKSSDPKELGQSSKGWDYWYAAFLQLFEHFNATIPQGQKLPHYWSGPINYATSDPSIINKWGYYYDGTTNYMINPYLNASMILEFQKNTGTEAVIQKMLERNPNTLEITGFDPRFFGKKPIVKFKQGKPIVNLDVRDVIFGSYAYDDHSHDTVHIQESVKSRKMITTDAFINGRHVIKSFIPVAADNPYVIGISFDRAAIDRELRHQLLLHCLISLVLLLATMVASYILAGFMIRPIRQILAAVNQVAAGNFTSRLVSPRKDELGLLSMKVNTMTDNLSSYTTQLKDAAEELRQSEKLSVVGQLAAGVAHEIRNPLTTLKGFVQLQKSKGTLKESHLDVMLSELDRINFIVSEFLVLAKPQANHFQPANVKEILHDILILLDSQAILSNVKIELQFDDDVPFVHGEINQLKQVFINVLKNAIEAMPDGGIVILALSSPDPDRVMIRIIDHGHGIEEDELQRIGEPFFTRKENGTGLGLMVTQRIINNHRGSLTIQSKPGAGTCVEIVLPMPDSA